MGGGVKKRVKGVGGCLGDIWHLRLHNVFEKITKNFEGFNEKAKISRSKSVAL